MNNRSNDRPTPDIRAAMGRGGMRPGKIEKAGDPRRALTRLAMYLSPYKTTLALVLSFVLAYILLGLLEPYLIGRAIDQFISTRQINGLSILALLLLTAYLFDNGYQAASSWLMARISQDGPSAGTNSFPGSAPARPGKGLPADSSPPPSAACCWHG